LCQVAGNPIRDSIQQVMPHSSEMKLHGHLYIF